MRGILITVLLIASTLCLALALGSTTPGVRLWIGLPLAIAHAIAGIHLACRTGAGIMRMMEESFEEARHY